MTDTNAPDTQYGDDRFRHLHSTADASEWAMSFAAVAKELYDVRMDEGWLIGWFANAMQTALDVAYWQTDEHKAKMAEVLGTD